MERRSKIASEDPKLKQMAVALRKEATPAERLVWELLRGRRFQGLKFRRQHVLHGHIVDFFCAELGLCVELDGAPHLDADQSAKDQARDEDLRLHGYEVVRFMNEDVLKNREAFRLRLLHSCSVSSPDPPL